MPHIHDKPGQHDFTASAFIYREFPDGEYKLLLHRHKIHNVYLQVGGHVELNESPWSAVMHEITEESGYEPSQLAVLQYAGAVKNLTRAVSHPQPLNVNTHIFDKETQHYHTDIAFAFHTKETPNLPIGKGESQDIIYVGLSELEDFTPDSIFPNVRELGVYGFVEALDKWEQIPAQSYSTLSE